MLKSVYDILYYTPFLLLHHLFSINCPFKYFSFSVPLSLSLCVTQAAVGLQADQAGLAGFTSGRKIPPCNNHHTPRYNPLLQSSYIQPQTSLS